MSGGRTPSGPTEGGPQLEPHGGDSPLLVRSGLWSEDLPWRRPLLSAGLSWTGDLDWHGALWGRDARGRVRRLSWRLSYVWLAALAQGDAMDPALLRFRRMLTGDFSRPLTGPQHAQQNLPALQAQQRRRTGQRARAPLPLRAPAGFIREVWIPSQKEGQEKVVRYEPPKTTTQGVPKRRPPKRGDSRRRSAR